MPDGIVFEKIINDVIIRYIIAGDRSIMAQNSILLIKLVGLAPLPAIECLTHLTLYGPGTFLMKIQLPNRDQKN